MTSYLKKSIGFNLLKRNPFKACLNINGDSNFPKANKINIMNTIKKNKNKSKIIIDSKANKSYIVKGENFYSWELNKQEAKVEKTKSLIVNSDNTSKNLLVPK